MSINITMPALSPTMEEGNLSKWLVKEGDRVSSGDVIAEIETDKATMEVESIEEGIVAKIMVTEGAQGVKVNTVIAVLVEEGEDTSAVSAPSSVAASAQMSADQSKVEAPTVTVVDSAPTPPQAIQTKVESIAPVQSNKAQGERVFATPLARRIAQQNGIELSQLTGSGPRGRIVKADVEQALSTAHAPAMTNQNAPAAGAGAAKLATGMSDQSVLALYDEQHIERLPHNGMRRVIAERLTESAQTIPSYFVTMECELDNLLAARKTINDKAPKNGEGKPAYKISVNDFIMKAMAMALKAVPMANVSWTSNERIFHKHADVGVAVAVEDGLFTPIVRQAELKSLSKISAEVKDMAGRARSKRLSPEEYQGGSTAVSNLGMYGVKEFTSIINPPHASIVSIGAGEKRPVIRGNDVAIATVMSATFAFDHRAIDGALGAELASSFKRFIENPVEMLV